MAHRVPGCSPKRGQLAGGRRPARRAVHARRCACGGAHVAAHVERERQTGQPPHPSDRVHCPSGAHWSAPSRPSAGNDSQ
eukprot:11215614-Lingulodinium_polyedra.AAC.1